MAASFPFLGWARKTLLDGQVIPAHPLALSAQRKLDQRRQRALTRYYHAAAAGGIAVGVHTTQFAIRESRYGLFKAVLQLAAETVHTCDTAASRKTLLIAGVCGRTAQAVTEAQLARELGYHAGLLSLAAFKEAPGHELISHCERLAAELPLVGFYLQPNVGGRVLRYSFWRRFAEIPNVVAIKIAPFNRYQTLDVVRAVADAGRAKEIALYTGNDDNIVPDLLTEYVFPAADGEIRLRIVGGLLGHWACWTSKAAELLNECKRHRIESVAQVSNLLYRRFPIGRQVDSCAASVFHNPAGWIPGSLLTRGTQVTDANAAFFDAANNFAGCIPGIHEVLRRQGLLRGTWCLNASETLSPGQTEEIDRVLRSYPGLNDDAFVAEHLHEWLS